MALNWFRINSMVANPGKFQIMFLGSNIDNGNITFMIENKRVKSRGITIDDKLSFTIHIENLCSTASNRLRALARNIYPNFYHLIQQNVYLRLTLYQLLRTAL